MELMTHDAVLPVAACGEPQRVAARDVVPPEIVDGSGARNLQLRRTSSQSGIKLDLSPPSFVVAGKKFRNLPQLRPRPLNVEFQWSFSESFRSLPAPFDAKLPHIIQVEIGAKRLCLQPHAPRVLRFLPQGEIRADQGVGLLFCAAF